MAIPKIGECPPIQPRRTLLRGLLRFTRNDGFVYTLEGVAFGGIYTINKTPAGSFFFDRAGFIFRDIKLFNRYFYAFRGGEIFDITSVGGFFNFDFYIAFQGRVNSLDGIKRTQMRV